MKKTDMNNHITMLASKLLTKTEKELLVLKINWNNIVGTEVKAIVLPKKFLIQGKGLPKKLSLKIHNCSDSLNVDSLKQVIISKVNGFFGYQCIDHISIKFEKR